MDSVTQLALGAAVGHAYKGKKWKEKAMLWGAVGGTIPDLDVIANFWLDDIQSLSFHRGFSHSILFVIIMPALMYLIFNWKYKHGHSKHFLWLKRILVTVSIFSCIAYVSGVTFVLGGIPAFIIGLAFSLFSLYLIRKYGKLLFQKGTPLKGKYNFKEVYVFFLLSFVTHIFIDVCTTYGTQIFYPNLTRVTFNNISVFDPLYTLPLLLGLVGSLVKDKWNYWGLGLSTLYLLFTFGNRHFVETSFLNQLQADGYEQIERSMVTTSLFNNLLWNGIAERKNDYILQAYHSIKGPISSPMIIPKNRKFQNEATEAAGLDQLIWFSNGYYNLQASTSPDSFKYQDLRFGFYYKEKLQTPFGFDFIRNSSNQWIASESERTSFNIAEFLPYFRRQICPFKNHKKSNSNQ